MKAFTISSIQQIGIGTEDFKQSRNWYSDTFGFDVKILEDDTVAKRMLPYTGGVPQKRHACITVNLQGGGGLEIWQYSERTPLPVPFRISIGDTGIFAAKIKCRDVKAFRKYLSPRIPNCSKVFNNPSDTPCFYLTDLFGNYFQIIEREDVFIDSCSHCGGIAGAMIGVTDMKRSLKFYQEILGYDKIEYDKEGVFFDWISLPGGNEKYRRVLISKSAQPEGAFSGLLGTNSLELVQPLDRTPRKIYKDRFWGDPGFIQICYDVKGMKALGEFCESKGHRFTVDSCPNGEKFDMGEASGHFTYIEDPDGTLIEFVETHKIPILPKLGLYINLAGRESDRPLPKILFRLMGIFSRQ